MSKKQMRVYLSDGIYSQLLRFSAERSSTPNQAAADIIQSYLSRATEEASQEPEPAAAAPEPFAPGLPRGLKP